jgi:hypothetical protein
MHIELLFPTDWSSPVLIHGAVALVISLIRLTPSLNSANSEREHQTLQALKSFLTAVPTGAIHKVNVIDTATISRRKKLPAVAR